MPKYPHSATQNTESVLELLDSALESIWESPAVEPLPEALKDPLRVLERGRELLESGLRAPGSHSSPGGYDNEFRMAARNGKPIPSQICTRMRSTRSDNETPREVFSLDAGPLQLVPTNVPEEIEGLANAIAEEHWNRDRVDPLDIAKNLGVGFSFGHYEDYFDGLLECRALRFHIYINLDTNRAADSPRARFSFAHELGHYLLDWHRLALIRGAPAHGSLSDFESTSTIEHEADLFASNLLLPRSRLRLAASRHIDADEIKRLAILFGTSISATAIRCAKLDLSSLIVMRWTSTGRAWCWSSSDLAELTGNRGFRSLERIPVDSVTRQAVSNLQTSAENVRTRGTTLSTWFPTVRPGSSADEILIEECIAIGPHGAITILRRDR